MLLPAACVSRRRRRCESRVVSVASPALQLGITAAAQLFTDFGYQRRDVLTFPKKKLRVGGLVGGCGGGGGAA